MLLSTSIGLIAAATHSATARASAKKANILTRESAVLLLLFFNSHRRTAFRFHYGRPPFFIFKSRPGPRFSFPTILVFSTIPVSVFYAGGPQTMPSWPLN